MTSPYPVPTSAGGWCSLHGGYVGFFCPSCATGAGPTAYTWPPLRVPWTCPVCGNGCAPHADTCSHEKRAPGPPQEDATS